MSTFLAILLIGGLFLVLPIVGLGVMVAVLWVGDRAHLHRESLLGVVVLAGAVALMVGEPLGSRLVTVLGLVLHSPLWLLGWSILYLVLSSTGGLLVRLLRGRRREPLDSRPLG